MDNLAALMQGFAVAATPINLLMALAGAFVGTIVGLLPGIGPINGVAILLPIAFAMKLPATSALILLAAVYMGCEYGGRIASILVNIPGDAGSVMTTLDGFPLARKGEAGVALSISAFASFCGSLLASVGLVLVAPLPSTLAISYLSILGSSIGHIRFPEPRRIPQIVARFPGFLVLSDPARSSKRPCLDVRPFRRSSMF